MQEREITSRIRIDQLQPLLETTQERITAPMPAVKLEELLQPEPPPALDVQVTFRRTPRGTAVPELVELVELVEFESEETPLPRAVDGIALGTINGIPVHACGPDVATLIKMTLVDDVIEKAVDAAIDAEIHNAEIEAAIDAVTLPAPAVARPRTMAVALGLAAAFVTGIGLMLVL